MRPRFRAGAFEVSVVVLLAVIAAGFVGLLTAWSGLAASLFVPFQVPYLVSGAMGGLALAGFALGVLAIQSGRRAEASRRADFERVIGAAVQLLETVRPELEIMSRPRRLVAAVALIAAGVWAPAAVAQVPPLPEPPPELEPVTDLLPPIGDQVCGTVDGTLPTAFIELLGPWIAILCPPTTLPEPQPPVEEEVPVVDPVPTGDTFIEPVTPLAPPVIVSNTVPRTSTRRRPANAVAPTRPRAALQPTLASAPEGFAYRVVFLLPIALLGLGGYVGWLLNRPVAVEGERR